MSNNTLTNAQTTSEWNISTDIYGIVDQVDSLKARFIDDEDETTLALGVFGFLGDTEAKKIQTATIMTGELGNEMFPTRAKLDKNVLTHAIYTNIDGINAVPAKLAISVGIKEADLDNYMKVDQTYADRESFIFSRSDPIMIGEYEFHFDYDIILRRMKRYRTPRFVGDDNYYYTYTAMYDMSNKNYLSNINNSYLPQPILQNFNNYNYIFFGATVHQVSIEETHETMITDSIIDNKSVTFNFNNQMADFDVYVKDNGTGRTTRLRPYFYGSPIDQQETKYCWYLYINDSTIRIGFDSNSYIPGINSDVTIVAQTTLGEEGNFTYNENNNNALYVDFSASGTNKRVTCFIRCLDASSDGKNRKSTQELKALIPIMAMSRGQLTTETDLSNYFNLISTEDIKLKIQKKVDNQLSRIWYAYLLMKDDMKNIIPTNTITINVDPTDDYVLYDTSALDKPLRYIIPCGTTFMYTKEKGKGYHIHSYDIPIPYSTEYFDEASDTFYYRTPYNIVINADPLYVSYYMTIVSSDKYFEYHFVNTQSMLGFSTTRNHFERSLLTNTNEYRFTFEMTQSIIEDFGLVEVNNGEVTTNNIKCFLVLHQDGVPYRYTECQMMYYNEMEFSSIWKATLTTDNSFDTRNRIKLVNLFEAGFNSKNYGFFEDNTEAYLYICARFDEVYLDEDNTLRSVIPDMDEFTLVDVYKVNGGLTLFNNFTDVMNTRIRKNVNQERTRFNYDIFSVPVVGEHFFDTTNRPTSQAEEEVAYFTKELTAKKAYLDHALTLVDNNMDIDFKFFNTYGESKTYTVGYDDDVYLDHLDLTLNFKVKLNESSDLSTRDSIISYIKDYVEDVNDLGNLHFPNLIHDIKEDYADSIVYIDYRYFNDKDIGTNHIQLQDPDDPQIVPEFLNVRNKYSADGLTLIPCITVEIVT